MMLLRLMLSQVDKEWGVRELSRETGMPVATVHRTLAQLEEEGLVYSNSGKYQVGLEFYRIAWKAETGHPVRIVARKAMRELVQACNETVFLGLYDPSRLEMMFAEVVECDHPLRYVIPLHQWVPVTAGASGLAILAFLPRHERDSIVRRRGLPAFTDATIVDRAELEKALELGRAQGYLCTCGQRIPGAVGIAAPILGADGKAVGCLVVTIPEQRFEPQQEAELAELVMSATRKITRGIGGVVSDNDQPQGRG
jgi:DNA-binding IclR family transcriptional regulator